MGGGNMQIDLPNPIINPKTSYFGSVPSESEVEMAVYVLQKFVNAISSSNGSESKWLVQLLDAPTSKVFASFGLERFCEAFHLLQLDPSFKRLVVSLASDKALWDAIMSNELVRKLGEPRRSEEGGHENGTSEEPDLVARIRQWIWEIAKAKLIELVEKFQSLVKEMFQVREIKKSSDNEEQLKDKVRASLLLCVVVLLIVVLDRSDRV